MLQCEFIIWNDAKNAEFKCDGTIEEHAALQEDIAMKNIFDYGDGKVGLYRQLSDKKNYIQDEGMKGL